MKLNLAGNPVNRSGLGYGDFFNAVVSGLQRWKAASSNTINFDYWQGTDSQVYIPTSDHDGLSSIYFASHSTTAPPLSPNVLGLTQVWYNAHSGEILEADIVLNDRDFNFTNNPRDTSGYGAKRSSFTHGKNNVYIQNVVTHELGHTFGLSHSGGLQSSMLFMESPEQAHLSCDEMIGIQALYPNWDTLLRGQMTGKVVSTKGTPIFGAHVLAISQRRGTVLATSLTDPDGRYLLKALEPGSYFLMVEPYYAGPQALPGYYSTSSSLVCQEGNSFSRGFLAQPDGLYLSPVSVYPGAIAEAPLLQVHCNATGSAHIPKRPETESAATLSALGSASILGPTNPGSFGIVDRLQQSKVNIYHLNKISGHLELYALSYSLYSPIRSSLSLFTEDGIPIPSRISDPIYAGDSGYINHDSALVVDNLPEGNYLLKVSAEDLQVNDYPAGPLCVDRAPFLIVTGSLNEGDPVLIRQIPNNARCEAADSFPSYTSPPGFPPRGSGSNEGAGVGFCGSFRSDSNSKRTHPPSANAILGWWLPWIAMGIFARLMTHLRDRSPTATLK